MTGTVADSAEGVSHIREASANFLELKEVEIADAIS